MEIQKFHLLDKSIDDICPTRVLNTFCKSIKIVLGKIKRELPESIIAQLSTLKTPFMSINYDGMINCSQKIDKSYLFIEQTLIITSKCDLMIIEQSFQNYTLNVVYQLIQK
ncbi:unnamed protein product (macronuclear) [Paramecium tetraurelia]|uniref:Uncharacterized protein n=1 Tax=Paramecium tetraurelia TaxID=5888 RepID=A0C3Y5_PARTE|nr:uncharacterized protein GSPATT00034982001 [Paramecium tetraurelia]CAK65502.1 unnamed protein product [Paramecium tetraurelia]|eukprot:XP_001432899.1 hypothetical protein (macronuclear) [Paramecium tetraurelia strain d4-2]